jgi:dTDP-4-dehydrorhamnose reductase
VSGKSKDAILVIGATGLIGRALMGHLAEGGKPAAGTSRRADWADQGYRYLELAFGAEDWEVPDDIGAAVFCAGIGRIEQCEQEPALTSRINVHGTLVVVKKLVERGVFTVILSSNQVFAGDHPFVPSEEPYSPISEYGRQKVALEKELGGHSDSLAIVRLTKVLAAENAVFASWRESLRKGEEIYPFSDVFFSPVSLRSAVSVLDGIVGRRAGGIFQLSGSDEISYAEAAVFYADLLGLPGRLIRPVQVTGNMRGILSRHGSLDLGRLRQGWGLRTEEARTVIRGIAGAATVKDG